MITVNQILTPMNKPNQFLWGIFLLLPIFIHFFLLNTYLINFPTWADDFTFIQVIRHQKELTFFEFIPFLFETHNEIHRNVFGKLSIIIFYFLNGEFDFKTFTILANIQMIGVLIPFYLFIKKKAWSIWHLIPISMLLFATYGNLDNFSLIGTLTHTSALLFLVWIAYGLTCSKQRIIPIILSLAMPFVSTEGLAILPLVVFILIKEKHKLALPFFLFACLIVYFYSSGSKADTPSINLSVFFSIAYGFLSFIGISRIPISDNYRVLICALLGISIIIYIIILLNKAYKSQKLKEFAFPAIILYLIAATGILICLGRFTLGPISLIAISERFNSYGILPLIAIYLMTIETFGNIKLLPAIIFCYYLASIYYAVPVLGIYENRQKGDLINAYYQNESANYDIAENHKLLLSHNAYGYQYPLENIPSKQAIIYSLKYTNNFLEKESFRYESDQNMHYFNLTHPLIGKKQISSQFLVLQSKNNLKYFLFVPILNRHKKSNTQIAQCWYPKKIKVSDFNFYLLSLNDKQIKDTWKIKI